jgi:hypothetical protein
VRSCVDTFKAWRHIPVLRGDDLHRLIPFDAVPIAVDLVDDAIELPAFQHPQRAFYVFGPEDGTLGRRHLDWCVHRVLVPTRQCMNLAATVNVVLYDRMAKAHRMTGRAAGASDRTLLGGPLVMPKPLPADARPNSPEWFRHYAKALDSVRYGERIGDDPQVRTATLPTWKDELLAAALRAHADAIERANQPSGQGIINILAVAALIMAFVAFALVLCR